MRIIILLLIPFQAVACDKYLKIGVGYKFHEPGYTTIYSESVKLAYGANPTARIELGCELGNLTYGVSHHSQWLDGAPFNNKSEYYKTELFVDYKVTF